MRFVLNTGLLLAKALFKTPTAFSVFTHFKPTIHGTKQFMTLYTIMILFQ